MIYTLQNILRGFAFFIFIFWSAMWLVHLIALVYGKYRLHVKVKPLPPEEPCIGVSILKPLMGVDPHLASNLETFFTMSYPLYELLFCIEDEKDPAIQVVATLIDKYPKVSARVFTGGSIVGVNPKINNMNEAYRNSSYDFILISDSGIRMKEDTLLDMVNHMTDKTGIVHQMPFTCDRNGFAATLEKVYFGTAQSRMYLAADCLRVNCHTGMSTLMRKEVLEEVGGLKTFGCYLAEDFFIAKMYIEKGWRTRICSQPALQNSGFCDVNSFQARLTRWAKLRVAMLPLVMILEPLSECMVIGACAAWAGMFLFGWEPLAFYLVHILVWFLCDWMLLSIVQTLLHTVYPQGIIVIPYIMMYLINLQFLLQEILSYALLSHMFSSGSLPFRRFDFIIGWLFRECTGPYLFLLAVLDPTIKWRNRVFKLAWGGIAQEIKPRIT